jgi:hypothetical protein
MFKLIKKFRNLYPKEGCIYAVRRGTYGAGSMLVLVCLDGHRYQCLILPSMQNIDIANNEFRSSIDNGDFDFVEKLPKEIFNVCYNQYVKNIPTYK